MRTPPEEYVYELMKRCTKESTDGLTGGCAHGPGHGALTHPGRMIEMTTDTPPARLVRGINH